MSELIRTNGRNDLRLGLLATVSALTLLTPKVGLQSVDAASGDGDRPTVWIELGGQLEKVDGGGERFAPPFAAALEGQPFTPLQEIERPPRYSMGGEGKISFSPEDSDWVFTAGIRYGRSNGKKNLHEQTSPAGAIAGFTITSSGALIRSSTKYVSPVGARYQEIRIEHRESHAVIDFQAGRDVGLGLFSRNGNSIIHAGLRFAQFASDVNATLKADPDFHFYYSHITRNVGFVIHATRAFQAFHEYRARADISRSFQGLGPEVSWDATVPILGSAEKSQINIDWGINAALLFGRQKVRAHHQTTGNFISKSEVATPPYSPTVYRSRHNHTRSRAVVVPNVGGFAGLSFRYVNAKVSLGYRADFFFGAMDGGIDARKTYDRNFYGPFATISIGLGG